MRRRATIGIVVMCVSHAVARGAPEPSSELAAAGPAAARPTPTLTDDELFDRVFKRPRRDHERVAVPLLVEGDDLGPILVELGAGDAVSLPAEPIVAALEGRVEDAVRDRVAAAVHDGRIDAEALRALGLDVTFDRRRLELRVLLPPELRARRVHDLAGSRVPAEAAHALPPSEASGYLNARGGGGVILSSDGVPVDRAPLHLNLDGAVNVAGLVLESRADFAEGPVGAHRGDTLLSRDDPDRALRLVAGDFSVPGTAFQPSFPVLGLGVLRSFALQPYRVIQPAGQFDFLLDRPSQVTIYVNGAPVQTLTLPAGPHDVRDLPLGAGVNDLELVIRDDRGIERRLSFSTATAGGLLVPGLSQFAYGIGFPLVEDTGARSYDWEHPALSLQHRLGLLPTLTVGTKVDASVARQAATQQVVWATPLGNLGLDLALSHDGDAGAGYAASLRYDYFLTRGGTALATALTAIAQHRSASYRSLGLQPVVGFYEDNVSLLFSSRLGKATVVGASLAYQANGTTPDAGEAAVTLSRSFDSALAADVSASARKGGVGDDVRLMVSAHYILPGRRGAIHTASRASSADGASNQATWSYSSGEPAGGLAASATVTEAASDVGANGVLDYTGYRFASELATSTLRTGGQTTQTTTAELGTALVFAGGEVGWSRPVTGSFVLIARNDTIAGHPVGVNPALGAYDARADALGVAVLPNLQPYTVSPVHLDAPDLPDGVSLGPSTYWLLPSYKSGTLIRVGEDGTVFVRGVLREADGTPVALATGEVVATTGPHRVPIPLLTNRAGRFGLSGLRPGHYEVRLLGSSAPPIPFEIPAGFAGVYSAGELTVASSTP